MIDQSTQPAEAQGDPFFQHVADPKEGSGQPYEAQEAKRELHRSST